MSQHHVESTFKDRPVTVVAGWDRPLRYVFTTVQYIERAENDEDFIYSNLDDLGAMTDVQEVEYFLRILDDFGIPTSGDVGGDRNRELSGWFKSFGTLRTRWTVISDSSQMNQREA